MRLASLLAEALAAPGRHSLTFSDAVADPDRPVTLHAYRGAGFTPDRPVVFVQHGMKRNGDEYCDFWIEAADKHGLLILAPTYSDAAWPKAEYYNNGNAFGPDGKARPRESWGQAILARLWAALRESGITRREQVFLYGHSAGGQFAHRLASTQDRSPFCAIIAANAGWYTLPTLDRPYPEGLGGIGLTEADLSALLAWPLTILAGDADTETSGPSLPSQPEAVSQGPHRFARANNYLAFARAEAARRGIPCHWQLHVVPGIGHDGNTMGKAAASLWFEGRLPDRETLARMAGQTTL
jgi:poly(3-hydroxybutyrate) depolymerase